MSTIKQVFLGAAVAGMVASAGSALGTAVAHADPSDTTSASDSATTSDSTSRSEAPSRGRTRGGPAATSDSDGAPVTSPADTAEVGVDTEVGSGSDSDAPAPRRNSRARDEVLPPAVAEDFDAGRDDSGPADRGAAQVPVPAPDLVEPTAPAAVESLRSAPAEPTRSTVAPAAAVAAAAVPEPVAPSESAPVVVTVAVAPAAAAPALTPAPAAPAPTPLRVPLLPDLPAVPVTPAGAVTVSSTSGTNTRLRAASAVAQAGVLADPPVSHVLLIGTDGTNLSKILEYAYDDPASGFRIAMDDGITGATSLIGHTTISGPSWSTILTGAWDNKTGVINNLFKPEPYTKWPTAINLIEYNKPDVKTAVVANWQYINDIAAAGGYPADVNEFVPFTNTWEDTDDVVAEKTVEIIQATSSTESTFIFSYQVGVDEEGHLHGGASTQYRDALLNTSENIAQILAAVADWETANPGEQWTVIITTDHGHQQSQGFGHGFQSPNETSSFVMFDLEGDDANNGKQNLGYTTADITPTIVDLFGIAQRSDFDGVPLQTKADGVVAPVDLKQALGDAISSYGYPDIGTDIALGTRTIFASIPYLIDGLITDITDTLQSVVDQDIFLISGLAEVTKWIVQFSGDVAVGITEAGARVVAYLTGSGTIKPSDPPLPAPPAADPAQVVLTAAQTALFTESPNLLVNPGAELGDPSLSGYSAVTIPGWTMTGTPTVIEYGSPRNAWPIGTSFPMPNLPSFLGFPKAKSGPPDGGNQFFGGGDVATGTLTQTVDLRGASADIDTGTVSYDLSGWLGGYLSDPSGASVKVDFLDANKTYLGTAKIGRVSALERWFQTGFKHRSTTGTLPTGTRYAQVVVTLEDRNWVTFGLPWLAGGADFDYNSAFADNISFTIGADLPAPPAPTPPVSTVGELDHVFMVYMENKGFNDIAGSTKAPFLNSLINAYGLANNYYGLTHPSLPNYYPVVGGTDFGLTYNCATPCIDADTTLVSNITDAGKTWKGYAQSLQPGANPLVASGDYSPDQLPFPAFKSIANDPAALANVVPLEQMAEDLKSPDTAPNFAWFAANEDFNGEGPIDFPWGILKFALSQLEPGNPYNIPALDQFLSETVPVVLNSEVWKDPTRKSALVVTFDEDNNNTSLGFGNEGNRVVFVIIPSEGAVAAGMRSGAFTATDHYNHYSLLRFIEDSLGLPTLTNNDKFAAPLNEFWDGGTRSGTGTLV